MKDKCIKIQKKFFRKENIKVISAVGFIGAAVVFMSTEAGATAIERLTTQSNGLKGLVKGTTGELALTAASVIGIVGAIMKGNLMLAVGILLVGIMFSWHVTNISKMFS